MILNFKPDLPEPFWYIGLENLTICLHKYNSKHIFRRIYDGICLLFSFMKSRFNNKVDSKFEEQTTKLEFFDSADRAREGRQGSEVYRGSGLLWYYTAGCILCKVGEVHWGSGQEVYSQNYISLLILQQCSQRNTSSRAHYADSDPWYRGWVTLHQPASLIITGSDPQYRLWVTLHQHLITNQIRFWSLVQSMGYIASTCITAYNCAVWHNLFSALWIYNTESRRKLWQLESRE